MSAIPKFFMDARERLASIAAGKKQQSASATTMPTDAAGKAFGTVDDPQATEPKPAFKAEPWQLAEQVQ